MLHGVDVRLRPFNDGDAPLVVAVGQIGLWTRDISENRASTGYWITEKNRGRGFARSALRTLTQWAFAFPELARIELHVEPWNEASWRTAESCGFEREGLLRDWRRVGSERRDMFVYSRLAQSENLLTLSRNSATR